MRMKRALVVVATLTITAALHAQGPATPASRTKQDVTLLASDELEGRLSGSAGEHRASDFISSELRRFGAKPLPGHTSFTIPFEFTAGTRDGGSTRSDTTGLQMVPRSAQDGTSPLVPCFGGGVR